jgi:1,4-dihydroxy-6-naphthoate synthase
MGPLVVGKRDFEPSEFANLRVAIPGADTVAAHLTHGLLPAFKEVVYCRYDQVLDLIENDEVECGVIIHETRFTYIEKGFQLVADLGEIWERKIDAPLPLGVLVARRDLGEELIDQATHILRASLRYAYERSEQAMEYVLKHSIEKDLDVVYDHIQTYVNEETMSMSDEGSKALQTLNELMQKSEETLSIRY